MRGTTKNYFKMLMYIEQGCSGAVKHRDVRERPSRTLRFFNNFCLVLSFSLSLKLIKIYVVVD